MSICLSHFLVTLCQHIVFTFTAAPQILSSLPPCNPALNTTTTLKSLNTHLDAWCMHMHYATPKTLPRFSNWRHFKAAIWTKTDNSPHLGGLDGLLLIAQSQSVTSSLARALCCTRSGPACSGRRPPSPPRVRCAAGRSPCGNAAAPASPPSTACSPRSSLRTSRPSSLLYTQISCKN